MKREMVSTGTEWEPVVGYSRALRVGPHGTVEWFDPRTGNFAPQKLSAAGPLLRLTTPTNDDWAARVLAAAGPLRASPVAVSGRVRSLGGDSVRIRLALWNHDAPASYNTEIVAPPRYGTLSGEGLERVYSPNEGFVGEDRFQWRARGDRWASNVATIVVYANVTGKNQRPRVEDQQASVAAGNSVTINLRYTDPVRISGRSVTSLSTVA